jgi:DNA repair protein RadD
MRVEYSCGVVKYREWVCFEHGGYATEKARMWWKQRGNDLAPETTEEALERQSELLEPSDILVRREGKYDRVASYRFTPDPGTAGRHERQYEDVNGPETETWGTETLEPVHRHEAPLKGGYPVGGEPGDDVPF